VTDVDTLERQHVAPLASGARLSAKQRDAMLDCDAFINLWNGAVSSGKTFSSLLAWAEFVANAPPGPLAMIGKTKDTLERNCIGPLGDMFADFPGAVEHTRGANTATIFGRLVEVLGANDARAENRIRGLTLAGVYVDEATLLPPGYWDMLMTRLRVPGARAFATTNPDHPRHPLKLEVIDRAAELGYRVWSFVMDDNPGLDPAYVARMKAAFVGLFYQRFILGLWVAATGAIYDMLDLGTTAEPGPHRVMRHNVTLEPERARLGVDYGTANATHAVVLIRGRRRSDGREGLVVAGEWLHSGRDAGRSLTDAEQSAAIRTWLESGCADPGPGTCGRAVSAWSTVRRTVTEAGPIAPERWAVDPSAASFKTQLRRDGVSGVRDADNHVLDGLRTWGSLIAADRLWFLDGAAPVLEGQMLGYVWDDDPAVDAPAKGQEDHGCDGGRYAVMSARADWRPWLTTREDTTPAPAEHRGPERLSAARRRAASLS
jgi:PBSX family phage terminase large subunit